VSVKRFEVSFDEKRIFDIYAVNKNTTEYDIHKSCDLINSLYEENEQLKTEVEHWKHRVSSLLFILSQFDNEKVKKLLEELKDE
jgi:regulator of replication initiation timing